MRELHQKTGQFLQVAAMGQAELRRQVQMLADKGRWATS
jgi:hypothetical protein